MINYEIVMEVTCSFDAGTPADPNHNKLVSNYNEIHTFDTTFCAGSWNL